LHLSSLIVVDRSPTTDGEYELGPVRSDRTQAVQGAGRRSTAVHPLRRSVRFELGGNGSGVESSCTVTTSAAICRLVVVHGDLRTFNAIHTSAVVIIIGTSTTSSPSITIVTCTIATVQLSCASAASFRSSSGVADQRQFVHVEPDDDDDDDDGRTDDDTRTQQRAGRRWNGRPWTRRHCHLHLRTWSDVGDSAAEAGSKAAKSAGKSTASAVLSVTQKSDSSLVHQSGRVEISFSLNFH
jgi:hypothetical protein